MSSLPSNGPLAARALACVGLASLEIVSFVWRIPDRAQGIEWLGMAPKTAWQQMVLLCVAVYAVVVSVLAVERQSPHARTLGAYASGAVALVFAIYAYRDLWPLATYSLRPADRAEGALLWVKISLAFVAGILVPLVQPRSPVCDHDTTNPPHPEQTASWLSRLTFAFVDPLVYGVGRKGRLPDDALPPLADYDSAETLMARSLPILDPTHGAPKRHLAWGLLAVFRREFAVMALLTVVKVVAGFLSPLGINRILRYLENGGEDAFVREWVWVAWIFFGPVLGTLAYENYVFLNTRTNVRVEAIVTQLVFDRALRISAAGAGAGALTTHVTADLAAMSGARHFLMLVVWAPLEIALSMWFLYYFLGWSAFVGLAAMLALVPAPSYIARRVHAIQVATMQKTDARVRATTETMGILRMIKLFAWERSMRTRIAAAREAELVLLLRRRLVDLVSSVVNYCIPLAHMLACYVVFTAVVKQPLSASIVFSTISVFNILRQQILMTLDNVSMMVEAKVALDRVHNFLSNSELLDAHTLPADAPSAPDADDWFLGLENACFAWTRDAPAADDFTLCIEGTLAFKRGALNLVVGPTGAGKTSLIHALLGEMRRVPGSDGRAGRCGLPRASGIALAVQESWVQNETIRSNILFGAAFDETRYRKVIEQCAIGSDLVMFEAGDETEVGEKGLTLSGGQKARITLARAVYSSAEIVLLDDVLAALDVHTAKWIVEQCLKGDLLRGRTVVLVTHNVALVAPMADFVVALTADGYVASQGSLCDALAGDFALREELADEQHTLEAANAELNPVSPEPEEKPMARKGTLILEEELVEGHMSRRALALYVASMAGSWPVLFAIGVMGGAFMSEAADAGQTYWLGYWAGRYDGRPASEVNVAYYLGVYIAILGVATLLRLVSNGVFVFGRVRASRNIHNSLIDAALSATLRWLDTTPVSRLIARCTGDIGAVDSEIPGRLSALINLTTAMIIKLAAIILLTPAFVFPGIALALVGAECGKMYIKALLAVKRRMGVAKAPVLGHFSAVTAGIVSIRAYGATEALRAESMRRVNVYTRVARTYWTLNRWITVRLDALGALFAAALAGYLVYGRSGKVASEVGFSIAMAVAFSEMILVVTRAFNDFEIAGQSLERIDQYTNIEQETCATPAGVPRAAWPSSGDLRVEGLSARYSKDGPDVLSGLSFHVKSGERIGIVGRTGSGKSTLTLALLRCVPTGGKVYYDGYDIASINLDALRNAVSYIPQLPELVSGTIRDNLDPFGAHEDSELHAALRATGLGTSGNTGVPDDSNARVYLDSTVAPSGANLSVGQRQLVALARALVRRSKLYIFDEATSAIDYETDARVQRSLNRELGADTTVLVVAHRLATIMDADRVMVLSAGKIIEFASPAELLETEKGAFRALVDESKDKDKLWAMVKRPAAKCE